MPWLSPLAALIAKRSVNLVRRVNMACLESGWLALTFARLPSAEPLIKLLPLKEMLR